MADRRMHIRRCNNGAMVVGPAICVQEFLVGFTYSVSFYERSGDFFGLYVYFRHVLESADIDR